MSSSIYIQVKPSSISTSERTISLQRWAANQSEHCTVPPIVHDVLRSSGQPLAPETRAFMESRFGHDFSRVRVHTDAKAAESARAMNARAYTTVRDIVFGTGQYAPETAAGQRLLAHELTHVVQKSNNSATALNGQMATIAPSQTIFEVEADRNEGL